MERHADSDPSLTPGDEENEVRFPSATRSDREKFWDELVYYALGGYKRVLWHARIESTPRSAVFIRMS